MWRKPEMNNENTSKSKNILVGTMDWMDDRFQVRALLDSLLHVYIPKESKTFYLGGITLFIFIVQGITGSLLALYYKPTPDTAYDSVLFITSSVNFGWLIRSIHSWGANLMIIFCILHLLRIYFQGIYKRPREITWVVGVGLLMATLGFGFTGYLLPWDERAFWATTVGSESFGAVPAIGEFLLRFMRGGMEVTEATLTRFFGLHTLWLPLGLLSFLMIHLVLVHQQGLANPKKPAALPSSNDEEHEPKDKNTVPFFPDYILKEGIAWYIVLGILIILASLFPVGLEGKADPFITPPHIKPEWYFLSLYQFLKYVPRIVGVLAPMVALIILVLLPFIDRNPEMRPPKRIVAILLGIGAIGAVAGLTILGWLS
jgi:quinol-cytochrome oxidoreductase complex cytochrome b subunit